jgi:hypothetical protein
MQKNAGLNYYNACGTGEVWRFSPEKIACVFVVYMV